MLLVAEGLTKIFRRTRAGAAVSELIAVDNIDLCVERGDIFGFLGPNGAGKSTTIRMILGLIHPTSGRVAIAGHDLHRDRLVALRKVGAFVEAPAFYPFLTGRRNLEIFADLSGGVPRTEMDRVVAQVGLRERVDEPVKVYSHGMRQRLGIAACLLPRPELLVLDEPTDGLDPHGVRETREVIQRLAREEGLTIFLSSHMLSEVENLCNRVAILERGVVIMRGELRELERQHRRVLVTVDRPAQAAQLLREKLRVEAAPFGDDMLILAPGTADSAAVNGALVHAGFAVRTVAPEPAWLDRLFLEKTTTRESERSRSVVGAESPATV